MKKCTWYNEDEYDPDGQNCYSTNCGYNFTLNNGTPKNNSFEFCPFCGKKIDDKSEYEVDE